MRCGAHLLKHWSKTQAGVALSSAEADLYAIVKGSIEGIGVQSLMRELGHRVKIVVSTDSAAARGAILQSGVSRMKHVSINQMWVQEKAARNLIEYKKVERARNPSDLMTHHWNTREGDLHLGQMHVEGCAP